MSRRAQTPKYLRDLQGQRENAVTPEEIIGTAIITLDEVQKARKQGADRERRRIRRALVRTVVNLKQLADDDGEGYRDIANWCVDRIDAATRATRRRKRK